MIFKLTGDIAWSWLWVLSPLWIGALVLIAVVGIVGLALAVWSKTVNGSVNESANIRNAGPGGIGSLLRK